MAEVTLTCRSVPYIAAGKWSRSGGTQNGASAAEALSALQTYEPGSSTGYIYRKGSTAGANQDEQTLDVLMSDPGVNGTVTGIRINAIISVGNTSMSGHYWANLYNNRTGGWGTRVDTATNSWDDIPWSPGGAGNIWGLALNDLDIHNIKVSLGAHTNPGSGGYTYDTAYQYLTVTVYYTPSYTKTASCDAALWKLQSKLLSMDAKLWKQQVMTCSADALLFKRKTLLASLDAKLFRGGILNLSMDALLWKQQIKTVSMDAFLVIPKILNCSFDALLYKTQVKTVSMDAFVVWTKTKLTGMDALLWKAEKERMRNTVTTRIVPNVDVITERITASSDNKAPATGIEHKIGDKPSIAIVNDPRKMV